MIDYWSGGSVKRGLAMVYRVHPEAIAKAVGLDAATCCCPRFAIRHRNAAGEQDVRRSAAEQALGLGARAGAGLVMMSVAPDDNQLRVRLPGVRIEGTVGFADQERRFDAATVVAEAALGLLEKFRVQLSETIIDDVVVPAFNPPVCRRSKVPFSELRRHQPV